MFVCYLQVYEKLNKYVREEVPIVNVCLLSGQPGIGKSTILANWYRFNFSEAYSDFFFFFFFRIKQWTDSGEAVVLYHFVKFLGSTSAEVTLFYRRILQQVKTEVFFFFPTVHFVIHGCRSNFSVMMALFCQRGQMS